MSMPALRRPSSANRPPYPRTKQVPIATMTSTRGESLAFKLRAHRAASTSRAIPNAFQW